SSPSSAATRYCHGSRVDARSSLLKAPRCLREATSPPRKPLPGITTPWPTASPMISLPLKRSSRLKSSTATRYGFPNKGELSQAVAGFASTTIEFLSMKTLVVEDDLDSRELLAFLLQCEGYEVVQAENGIEGWREFQTGQFKLVISDWLMPAVD